MEIVLYLFWSLVGIVGIYMTGAEVGDSISQFCCISSGVFLFIASVIGLLKLIKNC